MEGIPASVATNIAQRLVDRAITEAGYLFCFHSIGKNFEKEKKKLTAKRNIVQKEIEDARKRNETQTNDDVELWLEEVEGVIKEETTPKTCFFGWCPNCISRYNLGKQLAQKTLEIPSLIERGKFEKIARPAERPGMDFYSSPNFIRFKSREVAHEELLKALKDENNYIIGLKGLGGTGKSTLAIELGNEVEKSKLFDKVIFIVVSNPADVKKIQGNLATRLDFKLEEGRESEHSEMLWSRIANSKEKLLIILDDVWEELNLKEIGIPLDDHHKGCSVLITTRESRVCGLMGCQKTIHLDILSDDEAWALFQKEASISGDDDSLEGVARDIARECKGLPVAIVAVARTFRGRDLSLWKTALRSLRNSKPIIKVDEKLINVYKCLNFSYENIKSEKAKKLFLLCSLFPEDYEIPTEDLTTFGVGLGLFDEVDDYNSARGQALAARKDLIDSSLLLKAGVGYVKMHDLVREVAQWIANKDGQVIMEVKSNQMQLERKERSIIYLFCNDMDDFYEQFDGTKLEILLFNMKPKEYFVRVPDAFFEGMTLLKVLRIGNDDYQSQLSLPQSIQSLTNIRTLSLRSWKLGDISVLGNLQSLESLELTRCSFRNLPYNFTELQKLRLLRLWYCEIEKNNPFAVIERCRQLEELYINGEKGCWPHDSENDSESFRQYKTPPPLQRYHLIGISTDGDQWDGTMLYSWLDNFYRTYYETYDSTSGFLLIDGVDAFFSEQTFKYMIRRAEIVQLRNIEKKWTNLIPDIVPLEDECMNDLIKLRMDSCSKIQCLINNENHTGSIFSNLDELQLTNMENLEELCRGPLPSHHFLKKLKVLTIKQCLRLKITFFKGKLNLNNLKVLKLEKCSMTTLFLSSTAQSLELLEELKIVDCSDLKYIIKDEQAGEEIVEGDDNKSYGSMFPKLKALHIEKCNGLEILLPVLSSAELLLLESIRICDCEELRYMFGQYQNEKGIILPSLKEIELSTIPKFIYIFPDHRHPIKSSSIQVSSSPPRRDGSKAKQSDPIRHYTFPWDHLCCSYLRKPESKSSTTSTDIQVVLNTSQTDNSSQLYPAVSSASKIEQGLTFGTAQYLLREPLNQYNIIALVLKSFPKLKSLFTLSVASTMMVEDLRVEECHELKHMIEEKGDGEPMSYSSIFPKLKKLKVHNCRLLEYIFPATFSGGLAQLERMYISDAPVLNYVFATYDHLSHQNQNVEIHVDLPALKNLDLKNLPNMVNMCPKNIYLTCPSLQNFDLKGLSLLNKKSFFDFILRLDPGQQDSTTSKKSEEIVAYETQINNQQRQALQIIQSLDDVNIQDCKLEAIFQLGGLQTDRGGDVLTSRLRFLDLSDLPELSYICKGPTQFLSLPYLHFLEVVKCGKLKYIFSRSIVKSLPRLDTLRVAECEELEQIIEPADENNPHSQHVRFPMLGQIDIQQCNKLTQLFPILSPNDLPRLHYLEIKECSALEKVFARQQSDRAEDGHLSMLRKLRYLILERLPELIEVCQGFRWNPEYEAPVDCPKLPYGTPSANVGPDPEFQAESQREPSSSLDQYTPQHWPTQEQTIGSPNLKQSTKQEAKEINGGKVPVSEVVTMESSSAEPNLSFEEIEESRDQKDPISQNVIIATHLIDSKPSNPSPGLSIIPPKNTSPQEGKVLKGELDFKEEEAVGKNETTPKVYIPYDIVQHDKQTADERCCNALATSLTFHEMAGSALTVSVKEKEDVREDPTSNIPMMETSSVDLEILNNTLNQSQTTGKNVEEGVTSQKAKSTKNSEEVVGEVPTSEEFKDEYSMSDPSVIDQRQALGEKKFKIETPQEANSIKGTVERQSLQKYQKSEKADIATLSTNSESNNPSPQQLVIPELRSKESKNKQTRTNSGHACDLHKSIESSVQESSTSEKDMIEISSQICSISKISEPCSSSMPQHKISRKMLEDLSDKARVNISALSIETSSSSMSLRSELIQELKTQLAEYLNMSLETISDANAWNNVEIIVNCLVRDTTEAIQKNILNDFASRLTSFKECVPKAMSTSEESNLEFVSNYENLNMELSTKLNERRGQIRDLEFQLSGACAEEHDIEMEIQRLTTRKNEILDTKNSLASQLGQSVLALSKDSEKYKALEEELKSFTDKWLKSKEDLAQANASWRIFKEILRL